MNTNYENIKTYGYTRVSTKDQNTNRAEKEIADFCKEKGIELCKIYTDTITGVTFDRPWYQILKMEVLRSGDTLIITEVDRLGRSKKGTLEELKYFKDKNIRVMILEIPTTTVLVDNLDNEMARLMVETITNMLIELYATFAESEMHKKKKRQREGIAALKARGDWDQYGRPSKFDFNTFCAIYQKVIKNEMKPGDLMHTLGMSKSTYYIYRERYLKSVGNISIDEFNNK